MYSHSGTSGKLISKNGVNFTYYAAPHVHAVKEALGSGGASQSISIRAKSTVCNDGVGATMELWVNGTKVKTWTNVSTSWTTYSQNATLNGNDKVEVVFTNDCYTGGYDRNLYVDYVVVNGTTIQAEGGGMVIDGGAGSAAFDGASVILGQETIASNGALRMVKGTGAFWGAYDTNGNLTVRVVEGAGQLLAYDGENHLVQVQTSTATSTFTYDGNGNRVKGVEGNLTTVYLGDYYEYATRTSSIPAQDVTPVGMGVACQDGATGTGYLMYSAEDVRERFAAHPPDVNAARHFICVKYISGVWKYDDNLAYYAFTPEPSDVLVAAVDYSADTVTSLSGTNTTENGIALGYASGNLSYAAD